MTISLPKSFEYVAEDRTGSGAWGTLPTTPTMVWAGLVGEVHFGRAGVMKSYNYLGPYNESTGYGNQRTKKAGTGISLSFTYAPQDWTMLQYITGSATGFAKGADSLSFIAGYDVNSTMEYTVLKGTMLTDFAVNVPKEDLCTIAVTGKVADFAAPTSVDPVGEGSHASESSSDPFLWSGISDVKMDANDPPTTAFPQLLGNVKFTISSKVEYPLDVASTFVTKAGDVVELGHSIELELELVYADSTFQTLVANETKQNLKFTLGGSTFTFKGLVWPDWVIDLKPEEPISRTVKPVFDAPSFAIA